MGEGILIDTVGIDCCCGEPPPPTLAACCLPDDSCVDGLTFNDCITMGGASVAGLCAPGRCDDVHTGCPFNCDSCPSSFTINMAWESFCIMYPGGPFYPYQHEVSIVVNFTTLCLWEGVDESCGIEAVLMCVGSSSTGYYWRARIGFPQFHECFCANPYYALCTNLTGFLPFGDCPSPFAGPCGGPDGACGCSFSVS